MLRSRSAPDPDCKQAYSLASLQDRLNKLEDNIYTGVSEAPAVYQSPHRQLANPSPLGLFGFAVVSILSGAIKITTNPQSATTGIYAGTAFFIGGLAQIVASIFQFLNNHTHSATTFGIYGLHWSSQAFILAVRSLNIVDFSDDTPAGIEAVYFALLTIVTLILWLPTFRMNKVLQATLFFAAIAFVFDIGAAFDNRPSEIISGVSAIIASSLAFYMALLDLVNEAWKKPVFPLFPHTEHKHDYDSLDGIPYVPKRTYHKSVFGSVHL